MQRAAIAGAAAACVVTGAAAGGQPQLRLKADEHDVLIAFTQAVHEPYAALPFVDGRVGIEGHLSLRGSSMGGPIRTRLLVRADLNSAALRLEPVQAPPPAFVFIATDIFKKIDDTSNVEGTLLLPRGDGAVQEESSRELLQALVGVPLSAAELLWVMTGSPVLNGSIDGYGLGANSVRVVFGDGPLPIELVMGRARPSSRWNLLSMSRGISGGSLRWRVDYGRPVRASFKHFRLRSQEWNGELGRTFDISFSWDRIEVGATFDDHVFAPLTRSAAIP